MEALLFAVVAGIPLVVALVVIDNLAGRVSVWRSEQHLEAATGAFWDRPAAAGLGVTRNAGVAAREESAVARRHSTDLTWDGRAVPAAPGGLAPPDTRHAA